MGVAHREEPTTPISSSDAQDGDVIVARFADLCKGLVIGKYVERESINVFKEGKDLLFTSVTAIGSKSPEEIEKCWSAFVLYCVTRLSKGEAKEGQKAGRITLCQILRACSMKIVDFFNELPLISVKAGRILNHLYGSDWEKRIGLKELQENVMQLIHLAKFYNRGFQEFFSILNTRSKDQASNNTENVLDFYRFGWLLFLALRTHAFTNCKNLVMCTNGLVSILAILIIHLPIRFRNFSVQDTSLFAKQTNSSMNLLASLSEKYHTSEDDLKRTMEKAHALIVDILKKKPCCALECKSENLDHISMDGLTFFEDLVEEKSLHSSLAILEKDYDDELGIKGDLDERIFINTEDSLLDAESLSGDTTSFCSPEWNSNDFSFRSQMIASHLTTHSPPPLNSSFICIPKMVPTPVSTAMTTAKWLRDIIFPLPSEPSVELQHFFSSCNQDITSIVTRRANIIMEAIFPSSSFGERPISGSLQSTHMSEDVAWAQERKMEALKLYYKVLKEICLAESQLLNQNNLTSLLSNERFHRCMLACSAELVLATHRTVILMFPAVLDRTGLTAFDMSKIIETFIRYEETLPRELKRHLNSLEERLLESMAWERGSSLYNSLILVRPALAAEINSLGLLAEPMPSLDAIAMHHDISIGCLLPKFSEEEDNYPDNRDEARSPKRLCTESRSLLQCSSTPTAKEHVFSFNFLKFKSPPLQFKFSSPSKPNPAGGEICAETVIKVFFNKILKLAAVRIKSLCEKLQLTQEIVEYVYHLFQQILSQRTALFFNRHIDQIILCSLYGVAKVCHIGLTFKDIVNHYKKQPQCKPQVFRSIFVAVPSANRNGRMVEEYVDIITFYNQKFIPFVKPLLVEIVPAPVVAEDKNHADGMSGQVPGSPKLCQFPNLPDMSPKKVSSAHNIYVSPLRQTKMDALLSPSSRSYYACIGESTRAYRSPSSDLTAINNRLNSGNGRRINGRLNFDLVSDSVVARILNYHNDKSASPDGCATVNLPMKHEEPDQ
ncbi:retinoblastoma-related protein-like [Canna indica]|uniref:Retinoblastoma-related protein-like n=1 Tax=Canna indica TaxID=4628 RepID=A0AAQ3KPD4_9LILI|nr:retinoblastoma-related protein-like [Canna indica]